MAPKCCVISCSSQNNDIGTIRPMLFKVPKDANRRQQWLEAITPYLRKGRNGRQILYVCELHFKEDDKLRKFSTVLMDGSVHTMPRQLLRLKPTSVPCIFDPPATEQLKVENLELSNTKAVEVENISTEMITDMNSDNYSAVTFEKIEIEETKIEMDEEMIDNSFVYSVMPVLEDSLKEYNFSNLINDLETVQIPKSWSIASPPYGLIFLFSGEYFCYPSILLIVRKDMSVEVRAKGELVSCNVIQKITSIKDMMTTLTTVGKWRTCEGIDEEKRCPKILYCPAPMSTSKRCLPCRIERKKDLDRKRKIVEVPTRKKKNWQKIIKNLKRKCDRLQQKVLTLKANLQELKQENIPDEKKEDFPMEQIETIKAAYETSKCKTTRHSNAWILECILLRIKNHLAYIHLVNQKVPHVPTIQTLNKHMKNLKSSYGFREETFQTLKAQIAELKPKELRGKLVLVSLSSANVTFQGFTDLGNHLPDDKKNVAGDHGLVFMFQPFEGKWVQTVGAFHTCANITFLHYLILECIILLENIGLFVDVVTTDGATWNKIIWKCFDLQGNEASCEHPCSINDSSDESSGNTSEERRLLFC